MNQASALCALHERLTMDTRSAFEAIGSYHDHADIEPTEAGREWLRAHHEYRVIWEQMVREGVNPETHLVERFGFIPDERDESRPRRTVTGRTLGHGLKWYRDKPRRYRKRGLERPPIEE